MSRYIIIRRLRGPAFLLLLGVIALLHQAGVIEWRHSWPLFLILFGALLLAERAALAAEGYPPYPGAPYGYPGQPAAPPAENQPVATGNAIVPANTNDYDSHGGQS